MEQNVSGMAGGSVRRGDVSKGGVCLKREWLRKPGAGKRYWSMRTQEAWESKSG